MTNAPTRIESRSDAVQLWKYLLEKGISFHWEDDPSEWVNVESGAPVLTTREAERVTQLMDAVAGLDDPGCYTDAVSLLRLALLCGVERVAEVPASAAASFETCSTPAEGLRLLARIRATA